MNIDVTVLGIDINQYIKEELCRDQNQVSKGIKGNVLSAFQKAKYFQSIFMAEMGIIRLSTQYSFSKYSQ